MEETLLGHRPRFAGGLQVVAADTYAWVQPNGGWGESNAGLVVGGDAAALIDTLWDIRLTGRMLAAMRDRTSVPIETVVNTHSDGDHVWGNQLLAGAEFIATRAAGHVIREETPDQMARFKALAETLRRLASLPFMRPLLSRFALGGLGGLGGYVSAMLAPYDFSGIFVTPPGREFDGELTVIVGGRELRLIEVGPAHTVGDLIVYVPDVRVCFAADVLFVGVAPVMWAGPTANWIAALERILALDVDAVVPGHGPVSGRAEVEVLRDYFQWLEVAARSALGAGRSPLDTARELLASREYRDAPWGSWDSPERMVITLATIDRHRRGVTRGVGARARVDLFMQVAALAAELKPTA
ncbi:MAG TPA: MBL fold metallo-hydrolase [Solirubrobacteraceae bacterium]|jgi:glyoxylase-like metal-dependent hydrolase (beta-lactamase superfamily II)|nr:MBL fold metallo-hydrolase [Solirubrobacteraceae bacterium]